MEDGTHCWACGLPGELGALTMGADSTQRYIYGGAAFDAADAALRESTRGRP